MQTFMYQFRLNIKMLKFFLALILLSLLTLSLGAEENGRSSESKALDSTATQWSFQLAYQFMPTYHQDTIEGTATTRPAGSDNYLQLRIVAPIPLKGVTILPPSYPAALREC